jgi:hypothetical protein
VSIHLCYVNIGYFYWHVIWISFDIYTLFHFLAAERLKDGCETCVSP